MIRIYEKVFNYKIDHFKGHPKYDKLRSSADEAIRYHTGYGLDAIHAGDFMDRIVKMPLDYIEAWLNGENQLSWRNPKTGETYDSVSTADALNKEMEIIVGGDKCDGTHV